MHKLIKRNDLPDSEVELKLEISFDEVEKEQKAALEEYKQELDLPGFRKGMAPDAMVLERVGELAILDAAAQRALNRIFPLVLEAEKIEVISAPTIEVTKLEKGEPLELTAKVAVMPTVELGDYKKISKEIIAVADDAAVNDEDVTKYIDSIRRQRAMAHKNAEHQASGATEEKKVELTEADLPTLDDAFAKSIGAFEGVDDLMKKVRSHLEEEKIVQARQKKRVSLLEKLVETSKITLPAVLVEQELDRMLSQFENDIRGMGVDPVAYYEQAKKTREEIALEWRDEAVKRAKANLILPEIAAREKLAPDMETVERETAHLMKEVKNADPRRTKMYVFSVLLNERVLEFLEGREPAKPHVHDEHCGHDH